jgi:DNA-binding NtrC family response regulator
MIDEPLHLLAIMELGGYPNLMPLYKRLGFRAEIVNSQRKAQAYLKKQVPDVIVAEYNFQSDFRDRTSNLETLMARLQRYPQVKVIVFFQDEFRHKLDNLLSRFPVFEAIAFPVEPERVEAALRRALRGADQRIETG